MNMTDDSLPGQVVQRVLRAQHEIRVDIVRGVVPVEVASFAELHDHVDANEYGGLCEPTDEDWTDDGEHLRDHWQTLAERVQTKVDEWLRAGGHRVAAVAVVDTVEGPAWLDTISVDDLRQLVEIARHQVDCVDEEEAEAYGLTLVECGRLFRVASRLAESVAEVGR